MFDNFFEGCATVAVILLVIAAISGVLVMGYGNHQTFDATITNTVIDNGMTYFILTDNNGISGVYENKDCMWFGKFNSADYLMNLKIGQKYTFFTIGYRVPFFSTFANIIRYTAIK
jgi:hypothetical protein